MRLRIANVMKIVVIHHCFPGQFIHLVDTLHEQAEHQLITLTSQHQIDSSLLPSQVRCIINDALSHWSQPPLYFNCDWKYPCYCSTPPSSDPALARFAADVQHGREVARRLQALKKRGFVPDVILAHLGWGEALFVKDVFPHCPLLGYCEYYYRAQGADFGFDREFSARAGLEDDWRVRSQNASLLLSLSAMDYGISPTPWQWSLFPPEYRRYIEVLHEGIDTNVIKADCAARFELPNGRIVQAGQNIVTYATRNLEPYRGFHSFLRAAADLCRRRSDCLVLIAGGDGVSYSPRLPGDQTYRERLLREVEIDRDRVIFLGHLPFERYLRLLQVSAVHVYLTVPFVLSWSLLEAMAVEKAVIASDTAPVRDVIVDGHNGLLVDFFSPRHIADRVEALLDDPKRRVQLGRTARQQVMERYDARASVARYERILSDLAQGHSIQAP